MTARHRRDRMKEFKFYAIKGNMLDLVIGIALAGAVGKAVTAVVSNLIMPFLGMAAGGINLLDLKYTLRPTALDPSGKVSQEALSVNLGLLLQAFIDFALLALIVFILFKIVHRMRKSHPDHAPSQAKQEELLTEIRDLLKKR